MELTQLNRLLPGKRAFITGGASGLGAAFAQLLAKNGWILHVADINREALEATSSAWTGAAELHLYALDVRDNAQYQAVARDVLATSECVDLLINNAGVGDGALFHNYEVAHWERVIAINLLGTMYGCHHFVPGMRQQQNGLVINIGSAAGFLNVPGMSAYNVSKAGVHSLSETLYHELKSSRVHVSVAMPSFFQSNVMQQSTSSAGFKKFAEKQMKYSKTNATELAGIILQKSAQGQFRIVHPQDARRNFFLKKWFPKRVEKQFEKMMARFKQF